MTLGRLSLFASGISGGFDPATLSLTGWWRNLTTTFPFSGTASAGISGNNTQDLITAGTDPSTGGGLNGWGTLDFTAGGSLDQIRLEGTIDDYVNSTAGSGWCLLKADTLAAAGTNYYDDVGLVMDNSVTAGYHIAVNSTGARFGYYDGTYRTSSHVTLGTGSWCLIQWKHDSSFAYIRSNSGSWTSVSVSAGLNATVRAGSIYSGSAWQAASSGTTLDGQIAEIGLSDQTLSDTTFDDIKSYVNSRYGLSL